MNFVGARLETARTFQGLTQRDLAQRAFLSAGMVSLYETGEREPSADVVAALAEAVGVTPQFFFKPLTDVWEDDQCSFRHRRTTEKKVKRRARAHGTLVSTVISHLATVLQFPAYDVPSFNATSDEEIERAADSCRRRWNLGADTPILYMGRVLERAGVVIVRHFEHSDKIDAFSRTGNPSVVVLNTAKSSTSRWIYDLAHELGHLVLHQGKPTGDEETERQADRFAGAFLLPNRAFSREFRSAAVTTTTALWKHVFSLKRRWRVSAQAIVRRAYQLGLLGAIAYRQACKYASAHGWRGRNPEPHEPEFVGPELLPTALESLERGLGVTTLAVCEALDMLPETFYKLTGVVPKQRTRVLKLGA